MNNQQGANSPSSRKASGSYDKPVAVSWQQQFDHINQWWADRKTAIDGIGGWGGRDLRNQEHLINTVYGAEEDINQILRYLTKIFKKLAEAEEVRNDSE